MSLQTDRFQLQWAVIRVTIAYERKRKSTPFRCKQQTLALGSFDQPRTTERAAPADGGEMGSKELILREARSLLDLRQRNPT